MFDYNILYFLPALIVYGVWTWIALKAEKANKYCYFRTSIFEAWLTVTYIIVLCIILTCLILGIKYFSN